jgi:hypothetical protein
LGTFFLFSHSVWRHWAHCRDRIRSWRTCKSDTLGSCRMAPKTNVLLPKSLRSQPNTDRKVCLLDLRSSSYEVFSWRSSSLCHEALQGSLFDTRDRICILPSLIKGLIWAAHWVETENKNIRLSCRRTLLSTTVTVARNKVKLIQEEKLDNQKKG